MGNHKQSMKLLSLSLLGVSHADVGGIYNQVKQISTQFGNEYIYALQNKREKTALKVSLARHNGDKGVVSYSNFKIDAERQKYQLQSADGFKDDECGVKVGNSFAGMSFGNQGYGRNDVAKNCPRWHEVQYSGSGQ